MAKPHVDKTTGRRSKYADPVTRTIIMEREDWEFAYQYGFRNRTLGIQRALDAARRERDGAILRETGRKDDANGH